MNEEKLIKRKQILAFSDVFLTRCKVGPNPYVRPYLPKDPVPEFDRDFCEESFEKYFSRTGQGVELCVEDVLLLDEDEWLTVLDEFRFICDNLIVHQRCWCGLPPCVSLPIAALAKMLISGSKPYKAFEALKKINWYCLPVIRGGIFEHQDYAEWVQELCKQSSLPRSLIKKDDRFDMNMHAGARLLEVIGRGDLFEVFKANANEAKWTSSRERSGYLEYAQYEKVWLGAKAGDATAFLTLLRYKDGARYYSVFSYEDGDRYHSAFSKEEVAVHARELSEMYQTVVHSYSIGAQSVTMEDAERLLLISFACCSSSADRIAEQGWGDDDYPGCQTDLENFETILFFKDFREIAQVFAWWRPSFISSGFGFIGLLDILNKVSILGSDVSFSADFIRYHRCIMRIVAADGRNCAGSVGEMEEIADRRCSMYRQVRSTQKGDLVWPDNGSDPYGTYFVYWLVRLFLGEFGRMPNDKKAKEWLFSWNLISYYPESDSSFYEPISISAYHLYNNSSYGTDPGFMLTSKYFKENGDLIESYAWANVSRMFGTWEGPSYKWMSKMAEELTSQQLCKAQRRTREIIRDFKGRFPPKYQCDRVEYLGVQGTEPEYDYFRIKKTPQSEVLLAYFLRGLIHLGVEADPDLDSRFRFISREYYYDDLFSLSRGSTLPTLPIDHAQAMVCFMKAFSVEFTILEKNNPSKEVMMEEFPEFMARYAHAMEAYVTTCDYYRMPKEFTSARDLFPEIADLPRSVSLRDLQDAIIG